MEELLEMITWSQLGIHEKPVSLKVLFFGLNCKQVLTHKRNVDMDSFSETML